MFIYYINHVLLLLFIHILAPFKMSQQNFLILWQAQRTPPDTHCSPLYPPQGGCHFMTWQPLSHRYWPSSGCPLSTSKDLTILMAAFKSQTQMLKLTQGEDAVWHLPGITSARGRREEGWKAGGEGQQHALLESKGLQAAEVAHHRPWHGPQLHIKADNKNCSVKLPDFYFCLS